MKQSPLYEAHKSLGARFTEMQGWEVPEHYGDPVSEHLAVRSSAGIMDMTQRGKILISGKDRAKFLQNILSQDINKLTPGTGGNATLLNTKGHMLAYMRIYSEEDSFLIDTEPGETDKIIEILNRYLFREDVKIEDVTLKYGLVTVQGPRSREIVCRLSGTDIKDLEECNHLNLTINNINCKIARTTYSGEEGYNIYAPWDDIKAVFSSEINPFGLAAYNSLRIEAGIPLYSIDMDEDTIPIEANLDHAISYTKGCYVGQETIARIKFKGHVNRILTGFSISFMPFGTEFNSVPETRAVPENRIIPQKGDRIYTVADKNELNIGVITSACFSPTLNKSIAIGYLRTGSNEPGTQVLIESKPHKISAVVTALPFYTN